MDPPTAQRRPNVLWIMADQLRFHALGRSGDPNALTPNLDRLAAQGVWCTNAISHYPVCMPYRAGLVTGLRPARNGVHRHGDFLDPGARTVAHAFADAGYRTSWVGKWHLAPESGAAYVTPEGWIGQDFWVHPRLRGGFQDWYGFNISNNYLETYICSGEKVEPRRLEGYQTDALTDLSIEYLEGLARGAEPDAEPWFHVISYESPHPGAGGNPRSPGYPVPDEYEKMFDPDTVQLRPNVPPTHEAAAGVQLAGYYRLIANLDANVGRLLAWLDASGQSDDTLVVFLSDHGEMGGSHGRRNKQVPYEESLHLPLIFQLPGVLAAGSEYAGLITGVDIFPTTAGLCGLDGPEWLDGLDHSAALTGDGMGLQDTVLQKEVLVQWEDTRYAFGDHPYRAIRTRRHTYVVARDDEWCLLFDHETDPFELNNLYWNEDATDLKRQLAARLLRQLERAGEEPPTYVMRRLAADRVRFDETAGKSRSPRDTEGDAP